MMSFSTTAQLAASALPFLAGTQAGGSRLGEPPPGHPSISSLKGKHAKAQHPAEVLSEQIILQELLNVSNK